MGDERVGRDEYFMGIAEMVARRSTCPRLSVGAVVIDGRNRILGTGYNGSPPGHPHCHHVGCKMLEGHCIRTIHAEVNAITYLTVGSSADTLTMYSTHRPCFECLKVIVSKGITVIKYREEYTDQKWEIIKDEYTTISFRRI